MVLSGLRVTHLQVLGNHFSSQQSVMASHPGLQGKAYTINNYHSYDFNCQVPFLKDRGLCNASIIQYVEGNPIDVHTLYSRRQTDPRGL